jgi:FAD/FMN-containing dehydrogenase
MASVPDALRAVISTDPRLRAAYSEGAGIYRIVPAGVALPRNITELRETVAWAGHTGTPLIARGAGSGIPGSPVGQGVVVDLRERMPRLLRIDAARREAVTSASITQAELNREAQRSGLRLPPDPSSSGWATLGGMVATNAAGARTVRYGPARTWVNAADLVDGAARCWRLGRGPAGAPLPGSDPPDEEWPSGSPVGDALRRTLWDSASLIEARYPKVRKNTAGYALDQWLASGDDLDLVIGSEGTLGFVTAVRWRLQPIPAARCGLRVALGSLDFLEPAVRAIRALEASALELLDRTFLDLVAAGGGAGPDAAAVEVPPATEALLLVEFERESETAARGVAGDAVRLVRELALDVVTALTEPEERQLWALRHAASPILARQPAGRRSMQVIEDGCVPLPRLGEYVRAIRDAAEETGITVVIFGHAGDGHLHVNALADIERPGWESRLRALYEAVNGAAIRLGGTVSGEHGDGRLRASLLPALYGEEVVALFRAVKAAFDPWGILNPGVKLPDGAPPLASLKAGPGASPIPADIAAQLREIERTGGYARSRVEVAAG